jgi:hypothetical protein
LQSVILSALVDLAAGVHVHRSSPRGLAVAQRNVMGSFAVLQGDPPLDGQPDGRPEVWIHQRLGYSRQK